MIKDVVNDDTVTKVVDDAHDKHMHDYEGTDHDKNQMLDADASFDINRDEEDKDIIAYQKSGDTEPLVKVFQQRVPTLKYWAYKHYYPGLTDSINDFYGHLVPVFMKAAQNYNPKRGSFNTCLYTFLLNRIKNIKNSKYAKKRISEEYEGPLNSMVLSLDYVYGGDDNGDAKTLKDIIKTHGDFDGISPSDKMSLDDTLEILAEGDGILREFFEKLSKGGSMASLIKEYKTKNGKLVVNDAQAKKIRSRRATRIVSDLIEEKKTQTDFELVGYTMEGNTVNYTIEMKKTKETDLIMKSIRQLRNNKELILSKIVGTNEN